MGVLDEHGARLAIQKLVGAQSRGVGLLEQEHVRVLDVADDDERNDEEEREAEERSEDAGD